MTIQPPLWFWLFFFLPYAFAVISMEAERKPIPMGTMHKRPPLVGWS